MKNNRVYVWMIGAVLAAGAIVGVTVSAHGQKAAGTMGSKQWLAAMDADHDGTVSKKEFEKYMSDQFDKADVDHDGTLDAKELNQLRINLSNATKP